MRGLWLISLLIFAAPAGAQAVDESESRNGNFGGKLLITDDPEGFWREWEEPDNPSVTTTSRITLARPVQAMIVFHDCIPAADGKCNVVARFELRRPDGKLYDRPGGGIAWSEAPARGHNLLASPASLGFRLEPRDPLGRYKVTATLTDRVAKKSITMIEYVTAEEENVEPPSAS